jgi:DNA/RNA endonuclease YhcR with UshA esterase domain
MAPRRRGIAPSAPFGFQFSVDDGSGEVAVFVHASTGINPLEKPWLAVGERVRVTGYSGRFAEEIELQPRFPDDLRPDQP